MELIRKIISKILAIWQRSKEKREFFRFIINAASRGRFSNEEIKRIEEQKINLDITDDSLKRIRANAYLAALSFIEMTGGANAEQEAEMGMIQAVLRIPDDEIEKPKKQLSNLRLLAEIKAGYLPTVSVNDIILLKGEMAHWSEPAQILEERVVNRRYEGGSQGMSVRIAKGLSYRVGVQKGHLVSDKAVIPVSNGNLIITSQRIIFQGGTKSINLPLNKLLEFRGADDGLILTDDKGRGRIFQFSDSKNGKIVEAIMSNLIRGLAKKDD